MHYAEYIDAIDETTQRAIIDDKEKDTFVRMYSTEWFNLLSNKGRREALCHILALLRWHEMNNTLLEEAPESLTSEDSDASMED